jgi:pimeloyl-ACP methyl ester carboxylesterase
MTALIRPLRTPDAGGRPAPGRSVVGGVWFPVGLVLTAVGVGVGIPHAVKVGPTTPTAVGLAALFAGVLACIGGARAVLRGTRRRHWFWLVPLMLLAAYAVLWSAGQAVAATTVPRSMLGARTPASIGIPYEDVRLDTSDNVQLGGWYLGSRNGAAVALMHGAGSTRSAVLDHAAVLAGHGYGVLLFDARGHGDSGGRAMDFGWHGDADVAAAVGFLAGRPDVDADRIGVAGMSMGGEEAIGAAAADDRIRAVVAEGATHRAYADRAWLTEAYGWRGGLQRGLDWLTYSATALLTDAPAPISLRGAAADAELPTLLIAAGAVPDEELAAAYIASGSPATVEVWTAPNTGHTDALQTHPVEWERRVTGFLEEALGTGEER